MIARGADKKERKKDACTTCRKARTRCERDNDGSCKLCSKRGVEYVTESMRPIQASPGLPTLKREFEGSEESNVSGRHKQQKAPKHKESHKTTASYNSDPDQLFNDDPFEIERRRPQNPGVSKKPRAHRENRLPSAGPSGLAEDIVLITQLRVSIQSSQVGGYIVLSPDTLQVEDSGVFVDAIFGVWRLGVQQVEKFHVKIEWKDKKNILHQEIEITFDNPEGFLKAKNTITWIVRNRQSKSEKEILLHICLFPKEDILKA